MRHPFRSLLVSSSSRALGALALPALIAFASLIAGCSDDPQTGDKPNTPATGYKQLDDTNNYTFDSTLNIDSVGVSAESDLTIKWDGIKNDIECHTVNPADDIDTILFLRFKSTSKDEVSELLDTGAPSSGDLLAPAPFKYEPNGTETSIKLSDFTSPDGAFVPEDHLKEADNVNLLIFQNGTSLGQGARAMVFVDPGTVSTTTIDMKDHSNADCSLLDWSVSLQSAEPVPLPKAGPWKVDWTKIKKNGQGKELLRAQIDRILIGFYEGQQVSDLETNFLNLEEDGVATLSYELKLDGVSHADLSAARERTSGDNFSGFDKGEGTWIMGLFCDACSNPAPQVLTILKPE